MSKLAARIRFVLVSALVFSTGGTSAFAQVVTSGPASCPGVALTFDLCPVRGGSGYDQRLIDYLLEHRIAATFFMSGTWMAKHEDRVKELLAVPFFEVGTHGQVHAHLPTRSSEAQKHEILGPVTLLKTKYDRQAPLFRPPYGEYDAETVDLVKALGLRFILWSVVSGDPDPTLSADQIERRLSHLTKHGSIIVMHANGKGAHTYEVVTRLYERMLPQRHLTPMTVSDVLSCRPPSP
ncbi:MAG: Putative polysaccharide deacetylase (fragment) [Nitrospira sp.]